MAVVFAAPFFFAGLGINADEVCGVVRVTIIEPVKVAFVQDGTGKFIFQIFV